MRRRLWSELTLGAVGALAVVWGAGCFLPFDAPSDPDAPTPLPPALSGDVAEGSGGATTAEETTSAAESTAGRAGGIGWTVRPDSHLEDRAARNLLPQLPDAREVFTGIQDAPAGDGVQGGLLLCDLRMPGTPWFKSRPDMRAKFTVGGSALMLADGRDNRDAATLGVPVERLAKGDTLSIELFDRDLFNKDDFLDLATTPFPGHFPLIFAGSAGKLQATCRHMSAAAVAQRLPAATRTADSSMVAWETAMKDGLDARGRDLGYPWDAHEEMEDGIDGVAALVGWSHATVTALRSRRTASYGVWMVNAKGMVEQMKVGAGGMDSEVDLAVNGASAGPFEVVCGADAVRGALAPTGLAADGLPRCVLGAVTSGGEGSEAGVAGRRLDVVFSDGRSEDLEFLVNHGGKAWFGSAGIPSAMGRSPLQDAALLRVVLDESVEVVRLP